MKAIANNKLNIDQRRISVFDKVKTMWKNEKMLFTSIFSFSHNVFIEISSLWSLNSGVCGKGLIDLFRILSLYFELFLLGIMLFLSSKLSVSKTVVTMTVGCPSVFIQTIASAILDGFQNNWTQLYSITCRCAT